MTKYDPNMEEPTVVGIVGASLFIAASGVACGWLVSTISRRFGLDQENSDILGAFSCAVGGLVVPAALVTIARRPPKVKRRDLDSDNTQG